MCQSCGCGDPKIVPVAVHEKILAVNDRVAEHNRQHFASHRVLAINLMGSPGSGKTAILEASARALQGRFRLGAVSGDLATDHDARRLRAAGIPSHSITTGTGCHLDAELIHHALHHVSIEGLDIFAIENVGNLVCPAIYDLGQAVNVVALSVTEGEDKPLKYPVMFRKADLVLLTKVDLLPQLPEVKLRSIWAALEQVMPAPALISFSARSGDGLSAWLCWLESKLQRPRVCEPAPYHQNPTVERS